MYFKIMKKISKRRPAPSQAYRLFEYVPGPDVHHRGGSWKMGDEVPRDPKCTIVVHAVTSRRNNGLIVKKGRYVLSIKTHEIWEYLHGVKPDDYADSFMKIHKVSKAMEKAFSDGADAMEPKLKSAIRETVNSVMAEYEGSEENAVRKMNLERSAEVFKICEKECRFEEEKMANMRRRMAENEIELEPVRETARRLAKEFVRDAMKQHHPDHAGASRSSQEIAHEEVITLKQLEKEIYSEIDKKIMLIGSMESVENN